MKIYLINLKDGFNSTQVMFLRGLCTTYLDIYTIEVFYTGHPALHCGKGIELLGLKA